MGLKDLTTAVYGSISDVWRRRLCSSMNDYPQYANTQVHRQKHSNITRFSLVIFVGKEGYFDIYSTDRQGSQLFQPCRVNTVNQIC